MSPVAKQMTSNTVVAMRDVMYMCFVGFSIQVKLCCYGWICSIIYSLPGCQAAFSDDGFRRPKSKNTSKNKELQVFFARTRQNYFFLRNSHACTHEFLGQALTMLLAV